MTGDITTPEGFSDTTEFSPWALEFQRLHAIVMAADQLAFQMNNGSLVDIESYFAVLYQFYSNLEPYITFNKDEWQERIDGVETTLEEWKEDSRNGQSDIDPRLIRDLRKLHRDLLDLKKRLGFGVPTQRANTTANKISNVLLGKSE
tara:strand:- start:190 stop:630 length:441 start_codon:yes stop_codon:yes gene_type:complete